MLYLLINNALRQFKDAEVYLHSIAPTAYREALPVLSQATIGQHTRHFIEFFQCLVKATHADNQSEKCVLNYDLRRRDRQIEADPVYALQALKNIAKNFPQLAAERPLWLESKDYKIDTALLLPTTLERELLYNIEHTIHHFALIKIGLQEVAPEIQLPDHFGFAPSTVYKETSS